MRHYPAHWTAEDIELDRLEEMDESEEEEEEGGPPLEEEELGEETADRGDSVSGETEEEADGGTTKETPTEDATTSTETAAAESTEGEEDAKPPGSGWVPRHRLNEVSRRLRDAEDRLAQLNRQAQEQPAPQTQGEAQQQQESADEREQLKQVNGELAQAQADGDATKIAELYNRQQDLLINLQTRTVQDMSQSTRQATQDDIAYDRRLSEVESQYPVLNPDGEQYNEELVNTLATVRDAFVGQGYSQADALDKALTSMDPVLQTYVAPAAQAGETAAQAEARKQEAAQRAQAAAGQQPPASTGVGENSAEMGATSERGGIGQMTEEEFEALPESKKKALRGDTVA